MAGSHWRRSQVAAVRGAKHLPDALQHVLDGARARGDGYVLTLTYEEATALNELCAWHVHTDASGAVTWNGRDYVDFAGEQRASIALDAVQQTVFGWPN